VCLSIATVRSEQASSTVRLHCWQVYSQCHTCSLVAIGITLRLQSTIPRSVHRYKGSIRFCGPSCTVEGPQRSWYSSILDASPLRSPYRHNCKGPYTKWKLAENKSPECLNWPRSFTSSDWKPAGWISDQLHLPRLRCCFWQFIHPWSTQAHRSR